MLEFDYSIDYKNTLFEENDKRYRIGRGEQGVLLVRPYTDLLCPLWRFRTPVAAEESASKLLQAYRQYKLKGDFIGMDMCRKFLEMGFTRSRRYANHKDGKKYDKKGNIRPQEKDWATSEKAISARIFKTYRDRVTKDAKYISMRKMWREYENHNLQEIQ